jgi:hypothetical protein
MNKYGFAASIYVLAGATSVTATITDQLMTITER